MGKAARWTIYGAVGVALGVALTYMFTPTVKPVVLQLGWIPDAHQLGFWVALEREYPQNHLDVEIRPGGADSNPIKAVVSGAATFGQLGGVEQLVVARTEGLPLQAVAAIHRESPHALISLKTRGNITEPSALRGKRVAIAFGDAAEVLFRDLMTTHGIDAGGVTPVPFRFDLTPLLGGDVDAVTGFSTDQPVTIRAKGLEPAVLKYSDFGVRSYGYTLVVKEGAGGPSPDLIARFLAATRAAWQWSFDHPRDAVRILKRKFADTIDEELEIQKLTLIRPIMLGEDGQLLPWNLDPQRLQAVAERYIRQNQIPRGTVFDANASIHPSGR